MAQPQPIKALELFLQQHQVLSIGSGQRQIRKPEILFLNGRVSSGLIEELVDYTIIAEQPNRASFLEFSSTDIQAFADLEEAEKQPVSPGTFNSAIVLATKHRHYNEYLIDKAQWFTKKGGHIIVAGAKNTGTGSLRKRMAQKYELLESQSKYHSIVFTLAAKGIEKPDPNTLLEPIEPGSSNYQSAKGLFSAGKIDEGSHLLAQFFDDRISGDVADLGAGWGYLSAELLQRSSKIRSLDCYETEWFGTRLTEQNLARMESDVKVRSIWHDITSEPVKDRYDWVIMNPPFHIDQATRTDLGLTFISKASAILKPGGKMLMVANRQLAYEEDIRKLFHKNETLAENGRFKIIAAANPVTTKF